MAEQYIGNYLIHKQIGAGGHGSVFLASPRDLPNLQVVLKILKDPSLAERFRQRAVPGESREQFRRRFELMAVQRTLKALGTFGYMASVRGNTVYLPYMPRTLSHARHILSRYPELERLWRTLARHIEELA